MFTYHHRLRSRCLQATTKSWERSKVPDCSHDDGEVFLESWHAACYSRISLKHSQGANLQRSRQ